jgi:hypothetical protein
MKTIKNALLLGAFGLIAQAADAAGSRAAEDGYHNKSLHKLANKAGVAPQELENLYFSLGKAPQTSQSSAPCVASLENNQSSRERFLDCLGARGNRALSADLGRSLFKKRLRLLAQSPTSSRVRTLALVTYIEDLVRENLRNQGRPMSWITPSGYLRGFEQTDFAFEDGDVVVGLGNSSLSSLISQITNTPSRYSHAFIVRKRAGKMTTLESLVETGVKEFPLKHFSKDPYNQLTVLRWKGGNRRQVAASASDWAKSFADREAPYDMEMDFSEDEKIYCSELIVKAYARATGVSPERLFTHQSKITSQAVRNFAGLMGVKKSVFFSPGDLFNTDYFEVVADYRKPGDLMRSWELYLMGDLFMERINGGHRVVPGPIYTSLPLAVWVGQLLPSIFHEDARLIPRSIGPYAMSVMATTETKIYKPAIRHFYRASETRNLLDNPLWRVRGEFERAMDTKAAIYTSFPRL